MAGVRAWMYLKASDYEKKRTREEAAGEVWKIGRERDSEWNSEQREKEMERIRKKDRRKKEWNDCCIPYDMLNEWKGFWLQSNISTLDKQKKKQSGRV